MTDDAGTIVEFDRDGLGWIDLADGRRIRFAYSACSGFSPQTLTLGARVRVSGTTVGFRGVLKATAVLPAEQATGATATPRARRVSMPWSDFVSSHPRWSDVESICLVPSFEVIPPAAAPPALFAPWRDEIVATTPTVVGLRVPDFRHPDPIEPAPTDCFSHGRVAFLEENTWPACPGCARPLEMCIQLSEAALAAWAPGRGSLVVLFCFRCGVSRRNKNVAYVRFVRPIVRVEGPDTTETASSTPRTATQRVLIGAPRRLLPAISWYRYRSRITPSTASSAVFGYFEDVDLEGPMDTPDIESMEDVANAFEDWIETRPPDANEASEPWGGAVLGGAPVWDQRDATPHCAHGEMRQLLEYAGGQFLDGALHVFVCPLWVCVDLQYVAEF